MIDRRTLLYQQRLGHYRVGNKIYHNRFQAAMQAKQSGLSLDWHFNESVFGSIDWTIPIDTPLDQLYRLRAQQLRDTYDYLILNFSGGIDSLTALHSFIDNGIFLDEILVQVPSNFKPNSEDHSNANYWSEIEYQARPHLKKYQHLIDPRTRIRFQDINQAVVNLFRRDDWADSVMPHCNLTVPGFGRVAAQYQDAFVLDLAMQGRAVGRIYGCEKPKIRHHDNKYWAYFQDVGIYTHTAPGTTAESRALFEFHNVEPFYWTPFMPEIVVKQCQTIMAMVKSNQRFQLRLHSALSKLRGWTDYETLIAPVIYTRYNDVIWRTEKVTEFVVRGTDNWFWQGADVKQTINFLDLLKWYDDKIDSSEFFEGTVLSGSRPKTSGQYFIGTVRDQ